MSGVQDFVDRRQKGQSDFRRHILGAQSRIQVPPFKLMYNEYSPGRGHSDDEAATYSTAKRIRRSPKASFVNTSDVQESRLDTDAEGFDATTVSSAGSNVNFLKDRVQTREGIVIGPKNDEITDSIAQSRNILQASDQVQLRRGEIIDRADNLSTTECEESSVGEDDSSQIEEIFSMHPSIIEEFNSEEFSQFYRHGTSPFGPEMSEQTMASVRGEFRMTSQRSKPNHQGINEENISSASKDLAPTDRDTVHSGHIQNTLNSFFGQNSTAMQPEIVENHQASKILPKHAAPLRSLTPHTRPLSSGTVAKLKISSREFHNDHTGQNSIDAALSKASDIKRDLLGSRQERVASNAHGRHLSKSSEDGQKKKRAGDIDYSEDRLSAMTFDQLSKEAFHLDPNAQRQLLHRNIASSSLAANLDFMIGLKDRDSKTVERSNILSTLPLETFDKCGDLILEKFSETVVRFKEARHKRRAMAEGFEKEISRQQDRVGEKKKAIECDLGRLKREGESVIQVGAVSP